MALLTSHRSDSIFIYFLRFPAPLIIVICALFLIIGRSNPPARPLYSSVTALLFLCGRGAAFRGLQS